MAYVLSSVSGNLISAASAGFAPTNSADVSAIASAYQVVSATATQLNAGTAYLTSVNDTPISASRAGNAANASLANSAWYDGTGRFISSLPDEATVSSIASAYAESAASSKMDSDEMSAYVPFSAISADENSAITSINGSSIGGGGASIPFTGYYYDSSTSATVAITADVTAVSSLAYTKYNGTTVNAYKGITDSQGIHHLGVASFIEAGAEINNPQSNYTLAFAPSTSMWTTSTVATGIFAPLQYGTGAGMFLNNGSYKGYLKGNEWFVANTNYGYARGEVHQSRGCRVIVEHTAGSWAALSAKNADANVTLNNGKYYGTAKMAVANSQAYVQVQRGNADSKYNSAKLDTDYLKFYAGMTTGYLDPDDTASGTAYMPSETEYMYISSIPYWNAKLDASAIECDTASAITAIGGSAIAGGGGGVDSATVSAIASAYAESAVSSKADESALSGYYTTANESGFLTGLPIDISVRDLSASRRVRATETSQDMYGNFDYAGMYFRSGSQRPYNIGIDNTGSNFYIATAKNGFERIYASSIQSWNGKQDSSAMTAYVEKTAYDNLYSAFTALNDLISQYSGYFSSISAKVDNSAIGVTE